MVDEPNKNGDLIFCEDRMGYDHLSMSMFQLHLLWRPCHRAAGSPRRKAARDGQVWGPIPWRIAVKVLTPFNIHKKERTTPGMSLGKVGLLELLNLQLPLYDYHLNSGMLLTGELSYLHTWNQIGLMLWWKLLVRATDSFLDHLRRHHA